MSRSVPALVVVGVVSIASSAAAHITMTAPAPRTTDQKFAPCGGDGSTRGSTVTTFRAGETITITWNETIDHPSHYRIAFDMDGQDDFVNPSSPTDFYNNGAVLLDEIGDRTGGGSYSAEITLPDVACDNCTLQLIQYMYMRADPFYYQCADIVLVRDTPADAGVEGDAGTMPTDSGTMPPRDSGTTMGTDGGTMPRADSGGPMIDPRGGAPHGGCACSVPRAPRAGESLGGLAMLGLGAIAMARARRRARRDAR